MEKLLQHYSQVNEFSHYLQYTHIHIFLIHSKIIDNTAQPPPQGAFPSCRDKSNVEGNKPWEQG